MSAMVYSPNFPRSQSRAKDLYEAWPPLKSWMWNQSDQYNGNVMHRQDLCSCLYIDPVLNSLPFLCVKSIWAIFVYGMSKGTLPHGGKSWGNRGCSAHHLSAARRFLCRPHLQKGEAAEKPCYLFFIFQTTSKLCFKKQTISCLLTEVHAVMV